MKKLLVLLLASAALLAGCDKDDPTPEQGDVFYYYGIENRKIYLTWVKDKIYVKYAPEAEKESEIIENSDASLDYIKAQSEVISAAYLLQYDEAGLVAITDEFIVRLKEAASYAQLQALAKRHDCRIGAEDPFVENQYMLHVPKTSKKDAIQMANLFYETRLFEFSEPNFVDFLF